MLDLLKDAIREGHQEIFAAQGEMLAALESRRGEVSGRLQRLYMDKVTGEVPESV